MPDETTYGHFCRKTVSAGALNCDPDVGKTQPPSIRYPRSKVLLRGFRSGGKFKRCVLWSASTALQLFQSSPALVGIEFMNGHGLVSCVFAEILLIYDAILVDDEC